ncbi:glutathione binding-like protein [Parasphingopyxis sp.]|uniref:glutathione binding-like protein n=1 Tax=Parasphingopyxis sp. TaxID=1920299 RepID=UPI002625DA06|nr:glutathione binding-like protein [Parasphingopyxis sp.]
MKLYYSPGACSLAAHIALAESGADYEAIKVDIRKKLLPDGSDYRSVTPKGYVPALATDDAGLITEAPAVLSYLADHYDVGPSEGADKYAMIGWLGFIGTELHKQFVPLFWNGSEEAKQAAREKLAGQFALTVELMEGADWLVGGKLSVADNYLFVVLRWAQGLKIDLPAELDAYQARNLERASVQQALADEGLG